RSVEFHDRRAGFPLIKHDAAVRSVRFSGDGKWLLTVDEGGKVQVWGADGGAPVGKPLRMPTGEAISFAAFAPHKGPDGSIPAVIGTLDGRVLLYAFQLPQEMAEPQWLWQETLRGHSTDQTVNSACFSRDGQRLVTATANILASKGEARIWAVRDW